VGELVVMNFLLTVKIAAGMSGLTCNDELLSTVQIAGRTSR
jgi:hypothetical protein